MWIEREPKPCCHSCGAPYVLTAGSTGPTCLDHLEISLLKPADENRIAVIRLLMKNYRCDLRVALDLIEQAPVVLFHQANDWETERVKEVAGDHFSYKQIRWG